MRYHALAGLVALFAIACEDAAAPANDSSARRPLTSDFVSQTTNFDGNAVLSGAQVASGSPVTYTVDFGTAFSSVSEVDYYFVFGDDALDPGECLEFSMELTTGPGGGFCNVGATPQTARLLTFPCPSFSINCDLVRDGLTSGQLTASTITGGTGSFKITSLTVTVLGAAQALLAPLVDQFQLDGTEQNQAICCNVEFPPVARGQTFTVGLTGALSGLELSLFTVGNPTDLVVTILDMNGGDPRTAPALGSVSVPAAAVGPTSSILSRDAVRATFIDLTPLGIAVNTGDELAFRLTVGSPLPSLWAVQVSAFTDRYPGGTFFGVTAVNTVQSFGDAAFKTFVVRPVTVQNLAQAVEGSSLGSGEKTALLSELRAAEAALGRNQTDAAANQFRAFINTVEAFQRSHRVDTATGNLWIASAQAIVRRTSTSLTP